MSAGPKKPTGGAFRAGKSSKAPRRQTVRVQPASPRKRLTRLLETPGFAWGVLVTLVFTIVAGSTVAWSRQAPRMTPGRIAERTVLVRTELTIIDEDQTERERELARQRTPRVYDAVISVIEDIISPLRTLPTTVASAETIGSVTPQVRDRFTLSQERLDALQAIGADPSRLSAWDASVTALETILYGRPLLDSQAWQRLNQSLSPRLETRRDGVSALIPKRDAINTGDRETLVDEAARLARVAGFGPDLATMVTSLIIGLEPTYLPDAEASDQRQTEAAQAVATVLVQVPVGQRIIARGELIEPQNAELAALEASAFSKQAPLSLRWSQHLGALAMVGVLASILAGLIAMLGGKVTKNPGRMISLATLLWLGVLVSCVASNIDPRALPIASTAPMLLVAALLTIAYDRRLGLAGGLIGIALVGLGLERDAPWFGTAAVGILVAVWKLNDLRERRTVVSMSLTLAASVAAASLVASAASRPTPDWLRWGSQALVDAGQIGFGGLLTGAITLFILPLVERVFGVTTGMSLIELRDPKQPLLKEMQHRAPGTYNHSLNVASIAEAAAESIGADSLLTYVGCLYHDIGKINKPAYFVENQSGGINKHDKLSPAMSLLVIVGHVKDGMAMAREHGLPKPLQHFIEGHHGTTLVEYFYKRARKQAVGLDEEGHQHPSEGKPAVELESERLPDEVDYRYPGPKPHTKEVAILMLADAVESATRTLAEPTPARIDALVRQLATARLMDGQFDQCDLTLRELQLIVESISKTVASIYHGRIDYSEPKEPKTAEIKSPPKEPKSA